MTPEQKAFYEYGKARLRVEIARDTLKDAILDCNLGCGILHDLKHEILIYKSAIRAAWNARKECRRWVTLNKRNCFNCNFRLYEMTRPICANCINMKNWQPRKDEEQ